MQRYMKKPTSLFLTIVTGFVLHEASGSVLGQSNRPDSIHHSGHGHFFHTGNWGIPFSRNGSNPTTSNPLAPKSTSSSPKEVYAPRNPTVRGGFGSTAHGTSTSS